MQFLMAIDVKNTGVELFNFRFGIPCLRDAPSPKTLCSGRRFDEDRRNAQSEFGMAKFITNDAEPQFLKPAPGFLPLPFDVSITLVRSG